VWDNIWLSKGTKNAVARHFNGALLRTTNLFVFVLFLFFKKKKEKRKKRELLDPSVFVILKRQMCS